MIADHQNEMASQITWQSGTVEEYMEAMPKIPLLQRLLDAPGAPLTNWREIIDEINSEFARCSSTDLRAALLATFKATMDIVEMTISPDELGKFRDAKLRHYKSFVVQEATIGGNVCVETLDAVTQREIAAGRMDQNDSLRELAITASAEPHLSRAELVAMKETQQEDQTHGPTTLVPNSWGRRFRVWFGRG